MNTSQTKTNLRCTVCRKQKNELKPRKSKLIDGMQMFLCNDCFNAKREPRYAVVLIGRRDGLDAVKDYLVSHRYVGDEILASDLI